MEFVTFLYFFNHVTKNQKSMEFSLIIVTGDIIFVSTDWKTMHSGDEHENDCLIFLIEHNFEQVFDFRDLTGNIRQLDVFWVNEP